MHHGGHRDENNGNIRDVMGPRGGFSNANPAFARSRDKDVLPDEYPTNEVKYIDVVIVSDRLLLRQDSVAPL